MGYFLDDEDDYRRWRDRKLAEIPGDISHLIVEISDPSQLSDAEHEAMDQLLKRHNMVVYAGKVEKSPQDIIGHLATRFHLGNTNQHLCAAEDGITPIRVENRSQRYIPYTNRPISWHTDGYYNSAEQQIRAFILHCVQEAQSGGENSVMDTDLAYIRLREIGRELSDILHDQAVLCIPPNEVDGNEIRRTVCGPVFSIDPLGHLHMRYTARTRSIEWKENEDVMTARKTLSKVLEGSDVLTYKLQPGQGLLCNNILHKREGFVNSDKKQRLIYRARFYNRSS